jgi:hypothetical protein
MTGRLHAAWVRAGKPRWTKTSIPSASYPEALRALGNTLYREGVACTLRTRSQIRKPASAPVD